MFSTVTAGEFWIGIAAVISAIATGVVLVYTKIATTRSEIKTREKAEEKQSRIDAIDEQSKIITRQDEEIEDLKRENKSTRTQLHNFRDQYHQEMVAVLVHQARCEKESAEQRGEIKLLQTTLQRLQERTGSTAPSTTVPGLVIVDTKGVIKEFSPSLTPLLHWLPTEMRGRNVEMLIPTRLRSQHSESFKKMVASGSPPWTERVLLTTALTKEGDEIPVTVTLSGWKTDGGDMLISGQVQRRISNDPLESAPPQSVGADQ